tara:strand:- start:93 stop:863 length:771 start_codon:yes stop_codon:yes gene_type:complete
MNDLFIGGGGSGGIAFIGALEYIHENKLLDLKNFYGCSIGSLIGCLYITGYTPKNMLNKFLELDLKEIIKYDFSSLFDKNFIINDSLLDTLVNFIFENNSPDITLGEFYIKYGVNVNIYATNLTKNEYTNLNNTDYPDIKLKDAVKASMSIPYLFKPIVINDDTFVDGCCKNLYGSPDPEVYICGYSIIASHAEKSYINNLIKCVFDNYKPRTTYLIECNNSASPKTYLTLDKLDKKFFIELYKTGIFSSKKTLGD